MIWFRYKERNSDQWFSIQSSYLDEGDWWIHDIEVKINEQEFLTNTTAYKKALQAEKLWEQIQQ